MEKTKVILDKKDSFTESKLYGLEVYKWFEERGIPFFLVFLHETTEIDNFAENSVHTLAANTGDLDRFPSHLHWLIAFHTSDTLKLVVANLLAGDEQLTKIIQREMSQHSASQNAVDEVYLRELAGDFAKDIEKAKEEILKKDTEEDHGPYDDEG